MKDEQSLSEKLRDMVDNTGKYINIKESDKDSPVNSQQYNRLMYSITGLTGESGDLLNTFKKVIRDDDRFCKYTLEFDDQAFYRVKSLTDYAKKILTEDLADILWYVDAVAKALDYTLEDIYDVLHLKHTHQVRTQKPKVTNHYK